jgi:hypothetical protein
VSWNPAGLDDEGGSGEQGEDLLEEVVELGVMAEAFTKSVDTDLAVREDDTTGWGSLRGSKKVGDGHTDSPGFTKVVGAEAEAGRQPNGGEPRLHDEGARSGRAWVGDGGAICVDNRTSRGYFANELGSIVFGGEKLSRGAFGGLPEAFRGGGFGGVPNPDEVEGGGSDQRTAEVVRMPFITRRIVIQTE